MSRGAPTMSVGIVAALALGACWRSSATPVAEPPPEPTASPPMRPTRPEREPTMLDRFEQFADDICSCQDTACVQRVTDEMTKWSQDQNDAPRLSDEDTKRAVEIADRLGQCMRTAMTPPSQSPPPSSGSGTP